MAVAAEVYSQTDQLLQELQPVLPNALLVSEMLTDQETCYRAARFIGAVVLKTDTYVETAGVEQSIESLCQAIQQAAEGDTNARRLVHINARTDVIERTIKTGHVTEPVGLLRTENGNFIQHGQTTESVQANSLRFAADHPIMRARTEAETRNMFRTKDLYDKGFFADFNMVVISRAENLPEAGFFTDTMSCCIQVTSEQGDGLQIESAFVSGVAVTGLEQHDEQTVVQLAQELDESIDFYGKTAAEIIDMPILIPKDRMPNGVIDIVELFDDCAGGTFFGEAKPQQDYLAYKQKCREREAGFAGKVEQIVSELVAEAPSIQTPLQATERLHKISEKHMVEKAVQDPTINPMVFGAAAAIHIEAARFAQLQGDAGSIDFHMKKAVSLAESHSCPGAKIKGLENELEEQEKPNAKDEDCEFISKECPLCHKKNVKTISTKDYIKGDCGCKVNKK